MGRGILLLLPQTNHFLEQLFPYLLVQSSAYQDWLSKMNHSVPQFFLEVVYFSFFSTLWLKSLKKLCHASSSSVLRNIPLLPLKVLLSLTSSVRSTVPMLGGSLASGSSRFFRGDPKGGVAVFAQSSPLKSCSSSEV